MFSLLLKELIFIFLFDSGLSTPRFRKDLLKYKKKAGGVQKITLDYSGNFDDLHPNVKLARTWKKMIVMHMLIACQKIFCIGVMSDSV